MGIDVNGKLTAMEVRLSQVGKSCEIERKVESYGYHGRDGMAELTVALKNGMTPIISYWKADDMLWMDGPGQDGKGPCRKDDHYAVCSVEAAKFHSFSIEHYHARRLNA